MLGLRAIGSAAISSLPDEVRPAESVASGFMLEPRRRMFRPPDRGRLFSLPARRRIFGEDQGVSRCCINGGVFCKAAGESEFVYFDFTNRLGTRTLSSVADPVVAASGELAATDAQVLEADVTLEDGTVLEAGKAVAVLLSGGTAGEAYTVTVSVTLSDSAVLQQEGDVTIED